MRSSCSKTESMSVLLSYVARRQPCSAPLPMTNGLGSFRPLKCVTDRSGPVAARPPTCTSRPSAGSSSCKGTISVVVLLLNVRLTVYTESLTVCRQCAGFHTSSASPDEKPYIGAFVMAEKTGHLLPEPQLCANLRARFFQVPYQLSDALLCRCTRGLCARMRHQH